MSAKSGEPHFWPGALEKLALSFFWPKMTNVGGPFAEIRLRCCIRIGELSRELEKQNRLVEVGSPTIRLEVRLATCDRIRGAKKGRLEGACFALAA